MSTMLMSNPRHGAPVTVARLTSRHGDRTPIAMKSEIESKSLNPLVQGSNPWGRTSSEALFRVSTTAEVTNLTNQDSWISTSGSRLTRRTAPGVGATALHVLTIAPVSRSSTRRRLDPSVTSAALAHQVRAEVRPITRLPALMSRPHVIPTRARVRV